MPTKVWQVAKIDPKEPASALAFTFLLTGAMVAIIVFVPQGQLVSWVHVPFIFLIWLAESIPVILPRQEQRVSVSFAIVYASVLLFDPVQAAIVVASGVVLANLSQLKRLNIWLFNGSQIFINVYIATAVWHSVRPDGDVSLISHSFALAITAVALFLLNLGVTTVSVSLAYKLRPTDVFLENIKWSAPNFFVLSLLGILVVMLYQSSGGLLGVMLLWLPLLVVRYSFQQYMHLKDAHMQTIRSLAAALDAKDNYTHGHSQRVADYATKLATQLNLRQSEIEAIHYAGLLHDIGKIAIHDSILNKPGLLTPDELQAIRSHPGVGADIVQHVRFLDGISAMIRHHHEFYDGSGYPDGIAGDAIPLGARILGIADAFDAMTIDRVYRKGRTQEEAIQELIRGKGSQFDPKLVDVFVERVLDECASEEKGEAVEVSAS